MWVTILTYITGYLLIGSVVSFIPDIGEDRSGLNYILVWLFWPFVVMWILILILYMGMGWSITKLIKKIKDFKH